MENRDRDKLSDKSKDKVSSSNLDKSKSDSSADFGKNIGRSEDLNQEPSSRVGSQGSSGIKDRSSDSNEH
jgi:hypothetical protein